MSSTCPPAARDAGDLTTSQAHDALDRAVLAVYGWPPDLPDDELLARLLELDLEREPV